MKKIFALLCVLALLFASCNKSEEAWTPLFNGENLDNWEKFIGPPFEGHEDLAANAVPDSVFSVVDMDGQKVIRYRARCSARLPPRTQLSKTSMQD